MRPGMLGKGIDQSRLVLACTDRVSQHDFTSAGQGMGNQSINTLNMEPLSLGVQRSMGNRASITANPIKVDVGR